MERQVNKKGNFSTSLPQPDVNKNSGPWRHIGRASNLGLGRRDQGKFPREDEGQGEYDTNY